MLGFGPSLYVRYTVGGEVRGMCQMAPSPAMTSRRKRTGATCASVSRPTPISEKINMCGRAADGESCYARIEASSSSAGPRSSRSIEVVRIEFDIEAVHPLHGFGTHRGDAVLILQQTIDRSETAPRR